MKAKAGPKAVRYATLRVRLVVRLRVWPRCIDTIGTRSTSDDDSHLPHNVPGLAKRERLLRLGHRHRRIYVRPQLPGQEQSSARSGGANATPPCRIMHSPRIEECRHRVQAVVR